MFVVLSALALLCTARFPGQKPDVPMPHLRQGTKSAMVMCPRNAKPGERFPVLGFAHGDTCSPSDYAEAFEIMASYGFCVIAYRSCLDDGNCDDGRADFTQMLQMLVYLDGMKPSDDLPINMSLPISAAGHSTGGREMLMLAALQNKEPGYLLNTPEYKLLTPELKAMLPRIKAFCASHPDEMYADTNAWSGEIDNPDPGHFRITDSPVFVWTGSQDDWIEPSNSSWRNFADYFETPERVFIDVRGEGHMSIAGWGTPYAPYPFVQFIRLYAFNDTSVKDYFFGSPPGIWSQSIHHKPIKQYIMQGPITQIPIETAPLPGKMSGMNRAYWKNHTGSVNKVGSERYHAGYVACSKRFGQATIPAGNEQLCHPPKRYQWKNGRWNIPEKCRVTITYSRNGDYKFMGSLGENDVPAWCSGADSGSEESGSSSSSSEEWHSSSDEPDESTGEPSSAATPEPRSSSSSSDSGE